MKIIDFICKSDPLGNKEEVCPCNFFFFMQVPWADVLVQEQSQLQSHKSPEEQNRHISVLEPAQVLLTTQWSASSHGFVCSKVLPHHWCINLSVWLLSHFWWGDSTHLCLCKHSCVLFLFFCSSMYKIMPYFPSSLAYISSLAQTADTHFLPLGSLGRGQSRYTLLCAFRSMLGGQLQCQGLSTCTPRQREAARLRRHSTGCKPRLLPGAAPLCPWLLHQRCSTQGFLLLCLSWYIAGYLVSLPLLSPTLPSSPSSVSFCSNGCSWLTFTRLRDPWIRAGTTARQHVSRVSAARDLHTNLATGENPAQAMEGENESHPFYLMSFPKL